MATTLGIIITDGGIAEIVNAEHSGTAPVTLTQVGFGRGQYTPTADQTALHDEIKRVDTIAGGVVGENILHIQALDGSAGDVYTVYEVGVYTASGTLFAVYSQTLPILHKIADAQIMLAIDIVLSGFQPSSVTIGDTDFSLAPATTSNMGVVELATDAEATAGTDEERAVTPAALSAALTAAKQTLVKFDSDSMANEAGRNIVLTGDSQVITERAVNANLFYKSIVGTDSISSHRTEGNITTTARISCSGGESGMYTMRNNIYLSKYTESYITLKDTAGNAVNMDKLTDSGVTGIKMTGGTNKTENTFLNVQGNINAKNVTTEKTVTESGITADYTASLEGEFVQAKATIGNVDVTAILRPNKFELGQSNNSNGMTLSADALQFAYTSSNTDEVITIKNTKEATPKIKIAAGTSQDQNADLIVTGGVNSGNVSTGELLVTGTSSFEDTISAAGINADSLNISGGIIGIFLQLGLKIGCFWTTSNPSASSNSIWNYNMPTGTTGRNKTWTWLKQILDNVRSGNRTFVLLPYSTGTGTEFRIYLPGDTLPDSNTSGYLQQYIFGIILCV